jgi:hypothetical protein
MMALAGWRGLLAMVPRSAWLVLGGLVALLLVSRWHEGQIAKAELAGASAQAERDRATFTQASEAAAAAQRELVAAQAALQQEISKGTNDALAVRHSELARRYDVLRLRWAEARAGAGGSSTGGAIAISGASAGVDDAACTARGWVSLDTAAAAAEAADTAIAKDDAWIAWAKAQAAAWPKS